MAVKLPKNLKWLLLPLVVVVVIWLQLLMNGQAPKLIERVRSPKPVAIAGEAEVLALLKEPLKRAQAKGKVPVIRFNLISCGVCERVSRDVFTKQEWDKFAADKLDITDFLMPTTFTSEQPELVQRIHLMETLAKAAGVDQGFPLIAVLGRDGSLLGARAGYHSGGAENYVRWVEALSAADKSPHLPPEPVPATNAAVVVVTNTPPVETNRTEIAQPAPPVTNEVATAAMEVVVKGVSGTGDRRVVLLGIGKRNYPLVIGEKKRVTHDKGAAVVECREIGDQVVVVRVEGEEQDRRLFLPAP
jgi:thioredoxin-related protein